MIPFQITSLQLTWFSDSILKPDASAQVKNWEPQLRKENNFINQTVSETNAWKLSERSYRALPKGTEAIIHKNINYRRTWTTA